MWWLRTPPLRQWGDEVRGIGTGCLHHGATYPRMSRNPRKPKGVIRGRDPWKSDQSSRREIACRLNRGSMKDQFLGDQSSGTGIACAQKSDGEMSPRGWPGIRKELDLDLGRSGWRNESSATDCPAHRLRLTGIKCRQFARFLEKNIARIVWQKVGRVAHMPFEIWRDLPWFSGVFTHRIIGKFTREEPIFWNRDCSPNDRRTIFRNGDCSARDAWNGAPCVWTRWMAKRAILYLGELDLLLNTMLRLY